MRRVVPESRLQAQIPLGLIFHKAKDSFQEFNREYKLLGQTVAAKRVYRNQRE